MRLGILVNPMRKLSMLQSRRDGSPRLAEISFGLRDGKVWSPDINAEVFQLSKISFVSIFFLGSGLPGFHKRDLRSYGICTGS